MKKSQELPLNFIVLGAMALLVFLIVGGVVIFYGDDISAIFGNIGVSDDEVALTTFQSSCSSKCRVLNQIVSSISSPISETQMESIKAFCCESYDLDSDGYYETSSALGPEICSLAYTDCKISGKSPSSFCTGTYSKVTGTNIYGEDITETGYYDFTRISTSGTVTSGVTVTEVCSSR